MSSLALDELDRKIVHALHVDGRAPISHIASALGMSDQTVARRYRRLRPAGSLRVVGLPNARRLGTQIVCVTRARSPHERDALLLGQLPRTPHVTGITAHCLLRTFAGGPSGWHGRADSRTPERAATLAPRPSREPQKPVVLQEDEERMLGALARDGRVTYPEIAKAAGWSEMTAKRRLAQLRQCGALFFDVDIDPQLLGYETLAVLWLTVDPALMRRTAEAIAEYPEVATATAGPTNLLAFVACRDVDGRYDFIERRVGNHSGIRQLESAPVIRNSERAGAVQTTFLPHR